MKVCALLLIVVIAGASELNAQVSVSPFAGIMTYDGSIYDVEAGRSGSGFKDGAPISVLGIRAGYMLSPRWTAEGSYGRSRLQNSRGRVVSQLFDAELSYEILSTSSVEVLLSGGAGVITFSTDVDSDQGLSDPIVAGGIGALYGLGPTIDLRGDLRFYGQFCRDNHAHVQDGLSCNAGTQLGYSQLTGGVHFRF